jgi:hypothetical protein
VEVLNGLHQQWEKDQSRSHWLIKFSRNKEQIGD